MSTIFLSMILLQTLGQSGVGRVFVGVIEGERKNDVLNYNNLAESITILLFNVSHV